MGVNTTPFFNTSDMFGPFEPSPKFAFPPTCNPASHCSSIGPFMLGGHACMLTHTHTYLHTRAHTYTHIFAHVCAHIHTHANTKTKHNKTKTALSLLMLFPYDRCRKSPKTRNSIQIDMDD